MKSLVLLAALVASVSVSAQSLYDSSPGAYASLTSMPLDYSSQLGEARLLGAEAGYRLGGGFDLSLGVAGSGEARTVAVAPGVRYTAALSQRTGVVAEMTAVAAHHAGYRGGEDSQEFGGVLSVAAYVRVPVTRGVEAFPQLGVTGGVFHAVGYGLGEPRLGGSADGELVVTEVSLTYPADALVRRTDTQPTLSLDARLPTTIGGRLTVAPGLRLPMVEGSQILVRRVVPTLGLSVGF